MEKGKKRYSKIGSNQYHIQPAFDQTVRIDKLTFLLPSNHRVTSFKQLGTFINKSKGIMKNHLQFQQSTRRKLKTKLASYNFYWKESAIENIAQISNIMVF